MVKRGATEFRCGRNRRISLEDEPHSGHASEAGCKEKCRAVENVLQNNVRGIATVSRPSVSVCPSSVSP